MPSDSPSEWDGDVSLGLDFQILEEFSIQGAYSSDVWFMFSLLYRIDF